MKAKIKYQGTVIIREIIAILPDKKILVRGIGPAIKTKDIIYISHI